MFALIFFLGAGWFHRYPEIHRPFTLRRIDFAFFIVAEGLCGGLRLGLQNKTSASAAAFWGDTNAMSFNLILKDVSAILCFNFISP